MHTLHNDSVSCIEKLLQPRNKTQNQGKTHRPYIYPFYIKSAALLSNIKYLMTQGKDARINHVTETCSFWASEREIRSKTAAIRTQTRGLYNIILVT